jgi:hypothetical protein
MTVERTNNEVIIKLSSSVDIEDLQALLNYARYKELTSKFKIPQSEVDELSSKINESWWAENRNRLIK